MRISLSCGVAALAVSAGLALVSTPALAQVEPLAGKAFDNACVRDFYLEGNAIPAQKRNTVVLKDASGKRLVFGLLDTSGYSNEIQQKYIGMLILERPLALGSVHLAAGAYGFGLAKPQPPEGAGTLFVYDVGGARVAEAPAAYDAGIARPVPLQVVTKDGKSRLYVGRHWVAIE